MTTTLYSQPEKVPNGYSAFHKCAAWSPLGKFHYDYLYTTSANIKPGMVVMRATGAAGQEKCTEMAGGPTDNKLAFGIAEWDPNLVDTPATAYASGDLIPVISFAKNKGAILRNVILLDPGANVNCDHALTAGAVGMEIITEGTLVDSDSADGEAFPAGALPGTNSGTILVNREYMRMNLYLADPNAVSYVSAYIV